MRQNLYPGHKQDLDICTFIQGMGVNFWHWNLQNNKKDSEIKLRKWRGIPAFRQAQTSGTRYCKRRDRWAAWSLE